MRLSGRQHRFVLGSIGAWIAARVAAAWMPLGAVLGLGVIAGVTIVGISVFPWPSGIVSPPFAPARRAHDRLQPPATVVPFSVPMPAAPIWSAPSRAPELVRMAVARIYPGTSIALLRHAVFANPSPSSAQEPPAPAVLTVPVASRRHSRWAASAYVFQRPGSGSSLAAGGAIGGSQAAARLTYRLNAEGPVRTAVAVRLYAPLHGQGAEAAAGFDWHPLLAIPLRFSIERRIALDAGGRNAWSAYAAGGFYAERRHALIFDGYAQAGVVGVRSRDLFVDGALRAGRKLMFGQSSLVLGGGLWGAAQPGVSRVDAGPRAGLVVPIAGHSISAALEGRFRVAGNAHPGSGMALTLGVDF